MSLRIVVELAIAITGALVVPGPVLVRIATAVLVLGLLNAVNLLDGQDGLAAGVGVVITVGFATLGGPATPIALGLAGALAGFLVLNRPPARIYLGDAGAYFIGTTVALLPALTEHAGTLVVPLVGGAAARRAARRSTPRSRSCAGCASHRPLLHGDRSHLYDQLVDRGWTIGQSTLAGVGAQVLLTGLGLATTQAAPGVALGITLLTALTLVVLAARAGFLDAARGLTATAAAVASAGTSATGCRPRRRAGRAWTGRAGRRAHRRPRSPGARAGTPDRRRPGSRRRACRTRRAGSAPRRTRVGTSGPTARATTAPPGAGAADRPAGSTRNRPSAADAPTIDPGRP